MTRPCSDWMEERLERKFPVLDDGFVRVVDYMGTEDSIVQAARVSYGAGTKQVHEDKGLIRYLMRHRHTTPFEMCELKLHVRVPMDCWRQWIRHRMASVNEYSTRYSEAIDSAQRTPQDKWRVQANTNKQGSSGKYIQESNHSDVLKTGEFLTAREGYLLEEARKVYEERIAAGVAREQARKDLPLSTYTEAYWKIDLHNLLHFLSLRLDSHAQEEIRAYATVIGDIVSNWLPNVWEAFREYRLAAITLSDRDAVIIRSLDNGCATADTIGLASTFGWLAQDEQSNLRPNRERQECEQKLSQLGIYIKWT